MQLVKKMKYVYTHTVFMILEVCEIIEHNGANVPERLPVLTFLTLVKCSYD